MDLPIAALYAASEASGRRDASYEAEAAGGTFTLINPANDYASTVASGGFRISTGDVSWSLNVLGIGYGADVRPLPAATATASANRVEYDHGEVVQWYVNGPMGLQQGFTLDARPGGDGEGGPLTIALGVDGGVTARALADGSSVELAPPDGPPVATYGGLIAYDSAGRSIPATMTVDASPAGPIIAIHVDDSQAVYPLVVDPYIARSSIATPTINPGEGRVSMSDDGSTIVFGADKVVDSSGLTAGAVFVYEKSGGSWAESGRIEAGSPSHDGGFGRSAAISGDGSTIIVSTRAASGSGSTARSGIAFYERSGSTWLRTAEFLTDPGRAFGGAVAITRDASCAAVTLAGYPTASPSSVLFYRRGDDGAWTLSQTLTSNLATFQDYGDLAFDDLGRTLVAGERSELTGGGAVSIYRLDGQTWIEEARLTTPDPWQRGFGGSVAISGDGSTVAASVTDGTLNATAALVYRRDGDWRLVASLPPAAWLDGSMSGEVAVNADGTTVLAATRWNDFGGSPFCDAILVYRESAGGWDVSSILPTPDSPWGEQGFGASMDLRGTLLVVLQPRFREVADSETTARIYTFDEAQGFEILDHPRDQTVADGSTTTLTASADAPNLAVRWESSLDGRTWFPATGENGVTSVGGGTYSWFRAVAPTNAGRLFRAVFLGDDPNAPRASVPAMVRGWLTIDMTLVVEADVSPIPYGSPANFTAKTLWNHAVPGIEPDGDVELSIYRADQTLAAVRTLPVADGRASFSFGDDLDPGIYTYQAIYTNDGEFGFQQTQPRRLLVERRASTLAAAVPAETTSGRATTLVAEIAVASGAAPVGGGVMLKDGGRPIAFEPLAIDPSTGRARATFHLDSLVAGDHYFQFVYLGDPRTYAASSGVYRTTVRPAGSPVAGGLAEPFGVGPVGPGPSRPVNSSDDPPAPPPADEYVRVGRAITLVASAPGDFASMRWESSEDGGVTWTERPDSAAPYLTLTGEASAPDRLFRAVFIDGSGASTATSPTKVHVVRDLIFLDVPTQAEPRRVGDDQLITVTARAGSTGVPFATGIVRLRVGDFDATADLGPYGSASFRIPAGLLGVGAHQVVASYIDPSGRYEPTAARAGLSIVRGASSLAGEAPEVVVRGSTASLTAVLTTSGSSMTPNGGVILMDGGKPIAFQQLGLDPSGRIVTTFALGGLAPGDHYFQMVYLGDPGTTAASSPVYRVRVEARAAGGLVAALSRISAISAETTAPAESAVSNASNESLSFVEDPPAGPGPLPGRRQPAHPSGEARSRAVMAAVRSGWRVGIGSPAARNVPKTFRYQELP